MSTNVEANSRSILHKGHGKTHTCAVPDVCKTPSPGGPVPIPYVNVATDSNIADGADSVQIEGNPIANVAAKIATSSGDEAGTAGGGIMSSKIKGTVTWKMGSLDVKIEGKSAVRYMDTTFHNGNSFNASFIDDGGLGMGYADDFSGNCPVCHQPPKEHAIPSTGSSAALCAELVKRLRSAYSAGKKVTRRKNRGYMVGVMICRHATNDGRSKANTFAAMSGETVTGFMDVVNEWGEATPIGGDFVQPGELVDANTAAVDQSVLRTEVIARWQIIQDLDNDPTKPLKRLGYTGYGSCAASKLLARSNHGPIQMTEAFFNPPSAPPARPFGPYDMRVNGLLVGQRFWNADSAQIPSCNSCQTTLFMTMCPVRQCVAGGGASA